MDNTRQQIVDSIKANSNILVTVSTDPSVDELSAALGLTILLNNLDKRATAVFSGAVPAAINFLEPDKTFENTADSLRDFIIALDKEKADHLRYKVEGDMVKIFITPYRTTLTQADLDFSQGDYNVELVIAIGVKDQDHLDKALAAHGKILHDATVATVTAGDDTSNLGSIDWHDAAASSLSEMMVSLIDGLKTDKPLLDQQISTALLTGIVSATARFSNDRTSSRVMTMAAQLMAAGANQQLIAAKLEEAHDIEPGLVVTNKETAVDLPEEKADKKSEGDGTELTIDRSEHKTEELVPEEQVETGEKAADTPPASDQAVPGQQELEAQLASLTAPAPVAPPTMEDIEKELQQTPDQPPVEQQSNIVPSSDSTMPGFEAAEMAAPAPVVAPDVAAPAMPTPPIINDHGTFTDQPPTTSQPINSFNAGPAAGDATIDPFVAPASPTDNTLIEEPMIPPLNVPPLMPTPEPVLAPVEPVVALAPALGTDEVAAQLAAMPPIEPVTQPTPVEVPSLPPLPPLPTDGSLPPLPPPPPLPNFGQPGAPMPSGAVSGDVFGDAATQPQPAAPAPAEPGQFKIPGQG